MDNFSFSFITEHCHLAPLPLPSVPFVTKRHLKKSRRITLTPPRKTTTRAIMCSCMQHVSCATAPLVVIMKTVVKNAMREAWKGLCGPDVHLYKIIHQYIFSIKMRQCDLKPKHFDRPLVAGCSISSNSLSSPMWADWTNKMLPKMASSFKVVLIVSMNVQMFIFQISLVFKLDDVKRGMWRHDWQLRPACVRSDFADMFWDIFA